MHFHPHKDGARHLRRAKSRLQAAVAIGRDPAVCFAAVLPLPPDLDEMLFAGVLRQEGVRLVKAETVDIDVSANAEIILEGYIDSDEKRREGPFGDHTGFDSLDDDFPVFHVTAITHRKNPVYHTIIVGPPVQEDDATKKWPGEGFTGRWPDEIRMTPEIKAIVDKKWEEYGL